MTLEFNKNGNEYDVMRDETKIGSIVNEGGNWTLKPEESITTTLKENKGILDFITSLRT